MIVDFLFESLHKQEISYPDIAEHHHLHFRNASSFYEKCFYGETVKFDPELHTLIHTHRSNGRNLNVAISNIIDAKIAIYHDRRTLNTMTKSYVHHCKFLGNKIIKKIYVLCMQIGKIIKNYCDNLFLGSRSVYA